MKKLFIARAKEVNGEQEYYNECLLFADDPKEATAIARTYLHFWYDDGEDHSTDDPDVFKFLGGEIAVELGSVRETTFGDWVKDEFALKCITGTPEGFKFEMGAR